LYRAAALRAKPGGFFLARATAKGNFSFQSVIWAIRLALMPIGNVNAGGASRLVTSKRDLGFQARLSIFTLRGQGCHLLPAPLESIQATQYFRAALNQESALSWIICLGNLTHCIVEIQLLKRIQYPIALSQESRNLMFPLLRQSNRSPGGMVHKSSLPFEKRLADKQEHQDENSKQKKKRAQIHSI
jgi:hypothetical protein